jgi:hypothetical protein
MMLMGETKSLKDMTGCKQKQGTRQTKRTYLECKLKSITMSLYILIILQPFSP